MDSTTSVSEVLCLVTHAANTLTGLVHQLARLLPGPLVRHQLPLVISLRGRRLLPPEAALARREEAGIGGSEVAVRPQWALLVLAEHAGHLRPRILAGTASLSPCFHELDYRHHSCLHQPSLISGNAAGAVASALSFARRQRRTGIRVSPLMMVVSSPPNTST